MKIYDFKTFKENYENIKAIKFKKPGEIQYNYDKIYSYLSGKKFKAIYDSVFFDIIFIKIYFGETKIVYPVIFNNFNYYIEYVETKESLEIE